MEEEAKPRISEIAFSGGVCGACAGFIGLIYGFLIGEQRFSQTFIFSLIKGELKGHTVEAFTGLFIAFTFWLQLRDSRATKKRLEQEESKTKVREEVDLLVKALDRLIDFENRIRPEFRAFVSQAVDGLHGQSTILNGLRNGIEAVESPAAGEQLAQKTARLQTLANRRTELFNLTEAVLHGLPERVLIWTYFDSIQQLRNLAKLTSKDAQTAFKLHFQISFPDDYLKQLIAVQRAMDELRQLSLKLQGSQ